MRSPSGIDPALVSRFGGAGPRYTSYPTADRFVASFGPAAYRTMAARRNSLGQRRPLSLSVHLPFRRDIRSYCACNKIVTRDRARGSRYLEGLEREIGLQGAFFGTDRAVVRMHWAGATPTWYSLEELERLWQSITRDFDLSPRGEYAIEVDPRTVDAATLAGLRGIGFNRVSFGVQDSDRRVQAAMHRARDEEVTSAAIRAAREAGFTSVNVDMIHGLPGQTETSFAATMASIAAARPDRVALYNYAHLPHCFKSQQRIDEADLPASLARLGLFALAEERLADTGYVAVGMDHFALPADDLAVAQRQGRLRRDFQGYAAGEDCDVVGLGVSAIGVIGPSYSQNHRALPNYYESLGRAALPIARGIELTADDLLRRDVIHSLMCRLEIAPEVLEIAYLIDFGRYFASELERLDEFRGSGLIESRDGRIQVTALGRPFIRAICTVFDRHLRYRA